MNTKQQWATGLLAFLMLLTIVMMPSSFHGRATYSASELRQVGRVAVTPEVSAELPQDQVRDLTY
ncbi:MAG: hypothetical protein ACXWF2_09910 [Usitatibacter sp.]